METILSKIPAVKNIFRGTASIEIGYPCLTYGAIVDLEKVLNKEMDVLELGSGGSTIFFSRCCRSVRSYEHSLEWAGKVREYLGGAANVTLVVGPIDSVIEDIQKLPKQYDIILSDCGPTYVERLRATNAAVEKLKTGGFLIIDNYSEVAFGYKGWKVFTYDSFSYSGKGTRICVRR